VLETICSGCGEQVPPGSKFCNQCGTPVGAPPQAPLTVPDDLAWKIDADRESMEGERKQITVLFADVRGSMELAEKLDPESWRELMNRFFQVLADAVHHADGTVDEIETTHTLSPEQIGWFRAGSALSVLRSGQSG